MDKRYSFVSMIDKIAALSAEIAEKSYQNYKKIGGFIKWQRQNSTEVSPT